MCRLLGAMKKQPAQPTANSQPKMHDLFYCKLAGDDAERCLALAAALQNAPDFVLLEQVFAPEADIFCFVFLPVQKSFCFKCDFIYGQTISSSENWTANETEQLQNAVNQIAGRLFQTK